MKRPQLTAVNHYDVFPFNHGGSLGIRGLYKALSEWFDINIITFVTHDYFFDSVSISNHVKVIPIVLPEKLVEIQYKMYTEYHMSEQTLIDSSPTVVRWYHKFPEIIDKVREIAKDSVVVLAEHVFTWNIVKIACQGKHLWYRANNVEYDYKRTTWDKINCPQDLLKETYEIEKECCEKCERILAVSQLEIDRFMQLYNLSEAMRKKFINICSGYDIDNMQEILPKQRTKCSTQYEYSGVFIASDTPSTRVAGNNCILVAKECPNIQIIVVGGVGNVFRGMLLPENFHITGIVSDEEKNYYLQHCDFALNLLEGGAGINVKMFEYFAFGIPVITTKYGARGIEVNSGVNCIITDRNNFVKDIKKFCALSIEEKNNIAKNALELLINKYSWRSLSLIIVKEMKKLYKIDFNNNALPLEEIALYAFEKRESYLPKRKFYIRCAGEWGRNCAKFLKVRGLTPIAFVDEDVEKQGSYIDGIFVISLEQYLQERVDSEIIVAVWQLIDIAAELVAFRVAIEDISLAWAGRQIMHLEDLSGSYPYYNDPNKWRKEVLLRAKQERN